MLSLTDMWRAAGADPSKRPANWRDLSGTAEFVDFISASVGISYSDIFQVVTGGGNPGTWAHWGPANWRDLSGN